MADNKDNLGGLDFNTVLGTNTIETSPKLWQKIELLDSALNWNKSFPFQLAIVGFKNTGTDQSNSTSGVAISESIFNNGQLVKIIGENNFDAHTITNNSFNVVIAKYTLPFPPQELIVDMPINTTTYANINNSITEIHGGAPFRDIVLNGTTGILPKRGVPGQTKSSNDVLNSADFILGGVIDNTVSKATDLVNSLGSPTGAAQYPNIYNGQELNEVSFYEQTGFFYFKALEQFIEAYVNAKAYSESSLVAADDIDPKTLRLVLYVWKENIAYVCSGIRLTKKKSAQSPNEFHYTLQLKAWSRFNTVQSVSPNNLSVPSLHNVSTAASILNRFNAAKETLAAATNTVNEVGGIIAGAPDQILQSTVGEPMRQATMMLKGLHNIRLTVIDYPVTIQNAIETHIIQNWDNLSQTGLKNSFQDLISAADQKLLDTGSTSWSNVGILLADQQQNTKANEAANQQNLAISATETQNRQAQIDANEAAEAQSRANQARLRTNNAALAEEASGNRLKIFKLSEESRKKLFAAIDPLTLPLNNKLLLALNSELTRSQNLTKTDFQKFRESVKSQLDTYSKKVGLVPDDYGNTYQLNLGETVREATDYDFQYVWGLNTVVQAFDIIIASQDTPTIEISSLDYIAGLAQRSGIAFKTPTAKFAVPFPYGSTLEQLAYRYLGSVNRWHEIVALNGLRAPYIDEIGFSKTLLVNGNNNQILVADDTNLFINQTVWLKSNVVVREPRHIINLKVVSPTQTVLTLDGDPDLDKFLTSDTAVLETFLPGTVNSQQLIFIPSTQQAPPEFITKTIPGVDMFDPMLRVGGVDLLLTEDNDLVVTSDGDFRVSYGMANIIQSIRILLGTVNGSVILHPELGIGIPVGVSVADIDLKALQTQIKAAVKAEPYVKTVNSVKIAKTSNTITIRIEIVLVGTTTVLPVQIRVLL